MNLPLKDNARVWGSTATELKVAHEHGKGAVLAAYEKRSMPTVGNPQVHPAPARFFSGKTENRWKRSYDSKTAELLHGTL